MQVTTKHVVQWSVVESPEWQAPLLSAGTDAKPYMLRTHLVLQDLHMHLHWQLQRQLHAIVRVVGSEVQLQQPRGSQDD